jgi:dTDP-4-amino-4,6-dideoxy-D-galactose acyltransferase
MNSPPPNVLIPLPWDTELLGFGVARLVTQELSFVSLQQILAAARSTGQSLIYLVANPADECSNASIRQAGGWLAARQVTYLLPVAPNEANAALSWHVATETAWSPSLEQLALQSGAYSRFRLDTRFDAAVFVRLYQQWLRKSLAHELAREVFVYHPPGTGNTSVAQAPLGLMTLDAQPGRASIGLVAVDAGARRQGIGRALVQAAKQRAAFWQLSQIQVVTQLDNREACQFYQRCGFRQEAVEHIYHLWM